MAGPTRRAPPPAPPPIDAIVVDGANVIASSRRRPLERLELVERWCAEWRPQLPVRVFVDHATATTCRPPVQAVLRARCEDVTPGRPRYVVTPAGESADAYLLGHAREQRALVVSNDRFWDHDEERRGVVTVQFRLAGETFQVYDEATWFRGDGAVRIPLTDLARTESPP